MSDDSGDLEVSQQELGFESQDPSDQEEQEEGEQGDSPRGSRSPSPPSEGGNGEQQGTHLAKTLTLMTPPKEVAAVGTAARTPARMPLSPVLLDL